MTGQLYLWPRCTGDVDSMPTDSICAHSYPPGPVDSPGNSRRLCWWNSWSNGDTHRPNAPEHPICQQKTWEKLDNLQIWMTIVCLAPYWEIMRTFTFLTIKMDIWSNFEGRICEKRDAINLLWLGMVYHIRSNFVVILLILMRILMRIIK